jgi:hypothetical protein
MKFKAFLSLALISSGELIPVRCPRFSVFFSLALIFSASLIGCSTAQKHSADLPIRYHNAKYDLTFYLPQTWKGYSTLTNEWEGITYVPQKDRDVVLERGPIIVLRNPLWKTNDVYQDIPIWVFTRQQWTDDKSGKMSAEGAGGVMFELWHNDKYVFGIHSRAFWAEELKDWRNAENIVDQNHARHPAPHLYPE